MKFKTGDKVKCIRPGSITEGMSGIVVEVNQNKKTMFASTPYRVSFGEFDSWFREQDLQHGTN